MDVFCETLIKRKLTQSDKSKVMALFFTLIITSIIFILVIPFFAITNGIAYVSTVSMLIFAAILFFIWRALKSLQLEFEYIIINTSLDIDKIIAKKKRSRIISLDLKTVEDIGVYNPHSFKNRTFDCKIFAERDSSGAGNYYLTLLHPQNKRTLVVFSPDEKMLDALSKTLPRQLSKNISVK